MIIDSAVHIWTDDIVRHPWSPHDDVPKPDRPATAELLFATLASANVDAAICVQPRVYGYDHSYLASQLSSELVGICLVNPVRDDGPAELRHLIEEVGFRGLRLLPAVSTAAPWLSGGEGDKLWAEAGRLRVPVSLLVRPDQLADAAQRAEQYPHLNVVIDHLALLRADSDEDAWSELEVCARKSNMSIKISALGALSDQAWPHEDLHFPVRRTVELFGVERVMYGTDWPYSLEYSEYGRDLELLTSILALTREETQAVLGGNAGRIWLSESR